MGSPTVPRRLRHRGRCRGGGRRIGAGARAQPGQRHRGADPRLPAADRVDDPFGAVHGDRRRRHALHHPERQVLPNRHGAVVPAHRRRQLVDEHRRHGRQAAEAELRRPPRPRSDRTGGHPVLRVQRGRWFVHRHRDLAGRAAEAAARGSRGAGRCRAGVHGEPRRVHGRLPCGRRNRRSGRDGGRRDERRSPPAGPRLPGASRGAGSVRLRQRDEVVEVADADDVGRGGLLGAARLGAAGPDQDAVAHRRAQARRRRRGGLRRGRRSGVGPAPRHRQGGGACRRGRVGRGDARRRHQRRCVAPVARRDRPGQGEAPAAGACHRQDRRDADRAGRTTGARRRHRVPHALGPGELTVTA